MTLLHIFIVVKKRKLYLRNPQYQVPRQTIWVEKKKIRPKLNDFTIGIESEDVREQACSEVIIEEETEHEHPAEEGHDQQNEEN